MSYTPTAWQTGDTITANKLNKIETELVALDGDVGDLKSAVDEELGGITEKLTVKTSDNLLDVSACVPGVINPSTGAISSSGSSQTSDYIPVNAGDVVSSFYKANATLITTFNMQKICAYNSSKEVVSASGVSSNSNTYTVPSGIAYIRVSYNPSINYAMIVKGSSAPDTYIAYERYYVATRDFISDALGKVKKEDTDFWSVSYSINLFDKTSVVSGKYINSSGAEATDATMCYALVPIIAAGTYRMKVNGQYYGFANAKKIYIFDADGNAIKSITATSDETEASQNNLVELVISAADVGHYFAYCQKLAYIDAEMIVKDVAYPSTYTPYLKLWREPSHIDLKQRPLFFKRVVFDGDSICYGSGTDVDGYGRGWAGRIGVDNHMIWYNVAVSGATITAGTYSDGNPKHWICRNIDTIYSNYPDAEYIIVEGGTNDADIFYGDAEKLGTFDETDFTGPFDDETFYGAMDSLCSKMLSYYPHAKLGFIIAPKMGLGFTGYTKNRYDYFGYAAKVCKKWGIPVLNLWDEGQLRPDLSAFYDSEYNTFSSATEHGKAYYDGQHLTKWGYNIISHKIEAWMETL